MKKLFYTTLLVAGLFALNSCTDEDSPANHPALSEFLNSKPELSMFSQALDKAELGTFKNGQGPFTWFAPTNDAFLAAGITQDSLNRMTSGRISYVLLYHLINPTSIPIKPVLTRDMVAQNSFARTSQMGQNFYLGNYADSFYINGTAIISKDNMVSNGVVHVINRLQIPPVLIGNIQAVLTLSGQHSLFIAALTRASPNRWTPLGTASVFTVLAPTDAAMTSAGYTLASINASPQSRMDSLVRYHMFSNNRLFTNDFGNKVSPGTMLGTARTILASNVGRSFKGANNPTPVNSIFSNILATNGVVHIIDGVLRY